jgi:hypothetical protein
MLDPQIEEATRVLLEATGDDGRFGHLVRDPVTGEVELVMAFRGRAAQAALSALAVALRVPWWSRLSASLGAGEPLRPATPMRRHVRPRR